MGVVADASAISSPSNSSASFGPNRSASSEPGSNRLGTAPHPDHRASSRSSSSSAGPPALAISMARRLALILPMSPLGGA